MRFATIPCMLAFAEAYHEPCALTVIQKTHKLKLAIHVVNHIKRCCTGLLAVQSMQDTSSILQVLEVILVDLCLAQPLMESACMLPSIKGPPRKS